MAACYNPMNLNKNIDIKYNKSKNISHSQINELIKNWTGTYNLPKSIYDLNENKLDYIKNIIAFLNKKDTEDGNSEKIYWDIEAQKFLTE